jgi:L-amino acid N-acyltransferase YncA
VVTIRDVKLGDAEAISHIYNHYVINTIVSFEDLPVPAEEMKQRIMQTTSNLPWLVIEEAGHINGYAYASSWKSRGAYRFCAESTIYLHPACIGKGYGRKLYEALISTLHSRNLHCVIGVIALPNEKSVALHEGLGFHQVAHLQQIGRKFDQWIDVGFWELILAEH